MAKAIHSMIRVLDEARSVAFYDQAFGLKVADRLDFESFTLVYLSNAETGFELELTINKGRTEPYTLGDGYGHLLVAAGRAHVVADPIMNPWDLVPVLPVTAMMLLLVLLEGDVGNTLILAVIACGVLFAAGAPLRLFAALAAIGLAGMHPPRRG